MTSSNLRGHAAIVDRFRKAVQRGRLASSFLFVGPAGIGKRTFAWWLARALLCETNPESQLEACAACPACQQVAAASHPDLELVRKPDDKSFIPVELLIGDREHRMREGLCHFLSLRPFRGGRKIAIIDDADYLNAEGANCLLKTLEEPPDRSLLILIGTSEHRQLPTIRSRCQLVRFDPLSTGDVAALLWDQGLVESEETARDLAELSQGSLEQALAMADPTARDFRERLFVELSRPDRTGRQICDLVASFVDAAGQDAPPRRQRMKEVMGWAAEFYRQRLRVAHQQDATADRMLNAALGKMPHETSDANAWMQAMECCLQAVTHVDSNANQTTLLEWWADELGRR